MSGFSVRARAERGEKHRTDAVDVGAQIRAGAVGLLGRHVRRRSHDHARLGELRAGTVDEA